MKSKVFDIEIDPVEDLQEALAEAVTQREIWNDEVKELREKLKNAKKKRNGVQGQRKSKD
jgi:predicted ATP-dependent protease